MKESFAAGVGLKYDIVLPKDINKRKVYPHADEFTLWFLKTAVGENAHKVIPERIKRNPGADEIWTRMRNITGIYFTSPATSHDISQMYGISRTLVRGLTKRFIYHLWNNCSEETQRVFPKSMIRTSKSVGYRTNLKKSKIHGNGKLLTVKKLLDQGKNFEEIKNLVGEDSYILNRRLNSLGFSRKTIYGSDILKSKIEDKPESYEARKKLLDLVTRNFYERNTNLFLTMSQVYIKFGLPRKHNSSEKFVKLMKSRKVPVGKIKNSKGGEMHFIIRSDINLLKRKERN